MRSFDRIADRYDETRGGQEHGAASAAVLSRYLPVDGPLIELGVGTGLVAAALDRCVIGADISPRMMRRAHERIGSRLVCADAARLPFAPHTFSGGYAVWLLHLVDDQAALLREAARVLRRGAPFIVEPAASFHAHDPIQVVLNRLYGDVVGPRRDLPEQLADIGRAAGFEIVDTVTTIQTFMQSPQEVVDNIEARVGAAFWEVNDADWARLVMPRLAELRALDEPATQRERESIIGHVVFRKP
jgi:ubiquinone/menaquinone biosynthesis C-methylase UbiE